MVKQMKGDGAYRIVDYYVYPFSGRRTDYRSFVRDRVYGRLPQDQTRRDIGRHAAASLDCVSDGDAVYDCGAAYCDGVVDLFVFRDCGVLEVEA